MMADCRTPATAGRAPSRDESSKTAKRWHRSISIWQRLVRRPRGLRSTASSRGVAHAIDRLDKNLDPAAAAEGGLSGHIELRADPILF